MSEKITTELFFRVHTFVKEKYMGLSPKQKKLVKLILESTILSLAQDKQNYEKIAKEFGIEIMKSDSPIPSFNITVNVNEKEEKAKDEKNINLNKLMESLNELESLLLTIQNNNWRKEANAYIIPLARWKELIEKVNSIKKVVS